MIADCSDQDKSKTNTTDNSFGLPGNVCGAEFAGLSADPSAEVGGPTAEKGSIPCAELGADLVAEAVAEPRPVEFPQRVASATTADELRAVLSEHRVIRYFITEDPAENLYRLATYAVHQRPRNALEFGRKFIRTTRFDLLHGASDWEVRFAEILTRLLKTTKTSRGTSTVLRFIFETDIERLVPREDRVVARTKQRLTVTEIAYIARAITSKISDNFRATGRASAVLKGNYFLDRRNKNDGAFAAAYRKATRRKLNEPKLAAITDLLHRYGFVQKAFLHDDQGRRSGTFYRLGHNNYYCSTLLQPTAAKARESK